MGGKNSKEEPKKKNKFKPKKIISYKPEDFDKLVEDIKLINQIKSNKLFFEEITNSMINQFSEKYFQYINIKRFCIPIIGPISCGKSTIMNYLLPFHNMLETGEKVTTKFICIIRHKREAKIPEIYDVKIEKRDEKGNAYNFLEKSDNLFKNSNLDINKSLSEIIKNKNKTIKENGGSEEFKLNPENFFLLIKMDIPLFYGIYEKYGELIDFIDIPGLDEVREINCFDDYILPIFANILFPLFIFDVNSYSHDASKNIIIQYLNFYDKMKMKFGVYEEDNNIFKEGFFILNKIDNLVKDTKEEIIKDFKNIFKELSIKKGKIKLPFKENDNDNDLLDNNLKYNEFIAISAKKLLNEEGSFINSIIEEIIQKAKNSEFNSFTKVIEYYFNEKYNIDINNQEVIDKMEETEEIKNELSIINNHLEEELEDYDNPNIRIKDYIYIKQNLNKYNKKSENENSLKNKFTKRIKLMIDYFLNFEFSEIIEIYKANKEKVKEIEIKKNEFNEEQKFRFIKIFNERILDLFPNKIDYNYKKIKQIKNEINEFKKFLDNKRIRILFIGKISSGKTSLLNSIIGNNNNILPTSMKECTKANFIIKHSENGKISFCVSQLKENQNGNYFQDIIDSTIENVDEIKQKIIWINENIKSEKYYSLYIPIEAFQDKDFPNDKNEITNIFKNIPKKDIEIIDIPGIRDDLLSSENLVSTLRNLVNLCDGFIFTFSDLKTEDISSQLIFREILSFIKNKNESFNFNNCLFNLNYIDKIKSNEIEEKIKDLKDNIQKNIIKNIYKGNLIEKFKLKEKIKSIDNINISYFSNKRYEKYQKNILYVKNMNFLNNINNISLKVIYDDLSKDYTEIEMESHLDEGELNQKTKEIIDKIGNNISAENKIYIEILSKLILSIIHKKKELKTYKTSYADILFKRFREQIYYSYQNNKQLILDKFSSYLYSILLKLYYIDKLCLKPEILELARINIEDKKQIIIKKYDEFILKAENNFDTVITYLKEFADNIYKIINNNSNIRVIIKEYKLDELIDNLIDNLIKEINEMNSYYYEFSINQISELIENEGQFKRITQIIQKVSEYKESSFLKRLSKKMRKLNLSLAMIYYSNSGRILLKDYFYEKREMILFNKKESIEEIKKRKNIFVAELENLIEISSDEIKYLKRNNFNKRFLEFINYIENYE